MAYPIWTVQNPSLIIENKIKYIKIMPVLGLKNNIRGSEFQNLIISLSSLPPFN